MARDVIRRNRRGASLVRIERLWPLLVVTWLLIYGEGHFRSDVCPDLNLLSLNNLVSLTGTARRVGICAPETSIMAGTGRRIKTMP
jgi:hypothetical protein